MARARKREEPTPAQWRRAYGAAARLYEQRPWEVTDDTPAFGFEDPETGHKYFLQFAGDIEFGFCALSVIPGLYDVYRILDIMGHPEMPPEEFAEVEHIQAAFAPREHLEEEDLALAESVGFTPPFGGEDALWPYLRAFIPGRFPVFPDAEQLRLLCLGMEQAWYFVSKYRRLPERLDEIFMQALGEDLFRFRRRQGEGRGGPWEEKVVRERQPPWYVPSRRPDWEVVKRLRQLPIRDVDIEVELRPAKIVLEDPEGGPPYYPFFVIAADADTMEVVGVEMVRPIPTVKDAYDSAPGALLRIIEDLGYRPAKVTGRRPRGALLFEKTLEKIRIDCYDDRKLPAADAVLAAIREMGKERTVEKILALRGKRLSGPTP